MFAEVRISVNVMAAGFQQVLRVSQDSLSSFSFASIRPARPAVLLTSRKQRTKRTSLTSLPRNARFTVAANLASPLLTSAVATLGYQAAFFCVSNTLQTDRLTDLAGTSNIVLLAVLALAKSAFRTPRQVGVTAAVIAWGVRLGTFLFRRIAKWGEDRRFDKFRGNPVKLAGFWAIQAVWVWVCALPATLLASAQPGPPLRAVDGIGAAVYAVGLAIEAIADAQKPQAKPRGWPETGLWAFSRHPNYFGEILVWWGVYVLAAPQLQSAALPALSSPLLVTTLLMFVSGIPILEQGADEKFGHLEQYQEYKRSTSVLLPIPRRLYKPLPQAVKKWVLLDLPMYNSTPSREHSRDTEGRRGGESS